MSKKEEKNIVKKEITWGERTLSFQYGSLARQADSAVLARYGDTVVLATVASAPPREDVDFFPLSVDYEERLYAAGRISTSRFIKREGRPTDEAILNGRLIDRSIRPLFPKGYLNEIQVIVTVLSYDQENDPDIISLLATSAALLISPVPWDGPVVGVRIGLQNGDFELNPRKNEEQYSNLNLTITFNKDKVVMIEAGANQVPEDIVLKAMEFAKQQTKPVFELLESLQKEIKVKKDEFTAKEVDPKLKKEITNYIKENFGKELFDPDKVSKEHTTTEMKDDLHAKFEGKLTKGEMNKIFDETVKSWVREQILEKEKRPDGRSLTQVRPINVEVGLLPRTHGSAVFQRGDTQVLSVATLGSVSLGQLLEGMEGEDTKRFMHHYSFPPFSTGEVRRVGAPSRREIGHGALAEKALLSVVPSQEKFPYTIRVVSEVLSSSGSTSMGSTCGSTLALMDAGVPISDPISGIAMGLVTDKDKYKILTDIQALEDFYGDMDFKVAGSDSGVTAIQLDVKIDGLTLDMVKEIFARAKEGRKFILDKMLKEMPKSREEISKYAPKVEVLKIPPKKIGEVIGTGGKTINRIIDETAAAIDIEDDGTVRITGSTEESVQKAVKWIEALTHEVKPGEVYEGKVKRVMSFGAFVEILPGKEGMVHISQLATHRVEDINKEVQVGQAMKVKVIEIDSQGRINLTRKFAE
ncbi:MAG: polyribonucleotide nucleotidyltransferase [Candidatus Woykebacteria bacterium RIFCSPLOWO2_01_FULL_41_12]|uniref:Polyribonucleotide nucleotidyltransferase n=1 Tax=Candidatus Woykebacteria bacterium RIFCSPLOWO2_01_FULL_41_12 TaxID=1802604 RepID=A0A1G1WZI4_9BACT|nr:MAG: polyribonucleotide nucleotidyltransferase [Candidatus Woykebacteria bacterium RIFCSPLOWO2_01_FULL_41_12]